MYLINLDKKDLKWLQKGLNKKDIREIAKHILVKDGYAYATNGHVIHRISVELNEINGIYDYNGIKIDSDIKHPLEHRDLTTGHHDVCSLSIDNSQLDYLILDEEYCVNKKYFNNAVDNATEIDMLRKDSSIRIDYANRLAIIMLRRRGTKI